MVFGSNRLDFLNNLISKANISLSMLLFAVLPNGRWGRVCRTLLNTAGSAWDFRSAGSLNTDGQSVTYFRHSEKGSFLQAVFKLIEVLGHHEKDGIWKPRGGVSGFEEFRYLLHFAKMIRLKKVSIHQ